MTAEAEGVRERGARRPGARLALNDAAEAEGIAKLFGTPGPIVTSTKGVTGHSLGAAGALEAIAVLLAMQHGVVPPTDGLEQIDPALPAKIGRAHV